MNGDTGDHRIAVDAALRALDPLIAAGIDGDELERTLDALGAAIVALEPVDRDEPARGSAADGAAAATSAAQAPSRPRRGRRRRSLSPRGTLAIAAAVALLGLGGAAYAGVRVFVNAHTGKQLHGWERKTAGPGELINLNGTNVHQVLEQVSADIPFPKGYGAWRTWQLTKILLPSISCGRGTPGGCPTIEDPAGQIRANVASEAFCAWVADWQAAKRSGDTAGASQAAAMIKRAPSWKAVVADEPDLPGGLAWFGWKRYLAAVAGDDLAAVDRLTGSHGCANTAPPAASHGGTVVPGLHKSR